MKISMICFSLSGYAVMERLQTALEKEQHMVLTAAKGKYLPKSMDGSLGGWCREQFAASDGIIFVGASGIAVRTIAPFVRSKKTDPAVVVVDELGKYAISLLSGHLGGANGLAKSCADILGGTAVITTATDLNGLFAVDVFAAKTGMAIENMNGAKAVSAALLAGEPVGCYSEFPVKGNLPRGIYLCGQDGRPIHKEREEGTEPGGPLTVGFAITVHSGCRPFAQTAVLIPRKVILGLGCRKGKETGAIEKTVGEAQKQLDLHSESIKCAASIDLKAKEEGILSYCQKKKIPFYTYTAAALRSVSGDFTGSGFVERAAGVDNVCERSAICAGGNRLILKKIKGDGVTAALALEDWSVEF